jgi:hypothetical protein
VLEVNISESAGVITINDTGVYILTYNAQLTGASANIDIWIKINSISATGTNNTYTLQNVNDWKLFSTTHMLDLISGDTIELYQASTDVNAGLTPRTIQTSPTRPATASIRVVLNKISD